MKNLVYIGNALSKHGNTVTSIETLGEKLAAFYNVSIASSYRNKFIRLFDMMAVVFRNRKKLDFVLIDTYSTQNFYYALVIGTFCRLLKLKYISFLKGGNLEYRLKKNSNLSRSLFHNAELLIAPSFFLIDTFEKYGYKNLVCIPNSIEIKNYDFKPPNMDCIRLLWVRSFSKIYNPEMAIYVLESLIKLGFKAELCMVGPEKDGSLERVKVLAASKGLDVKFTGKLSKPEWISLSHEYNMFINTTNFDNTPVSVIEAMALGLPVISTNVGGIPYLIQDHYDGMLVEKNDIDGMVQAILNIYLNPSLANQIAEYARLKVELFDWEIIKHKWQEVLA